MADNLTPIVVKTKADGDVNVDINVGPTGTSALQQQGTVADGVAPNANPVLVAGFDGTLTQTLSTDASGNLQIDVLVLPVAPTNPGVDIGTVDVASVIPGVGATNLGKAQDTAVGATDTGIAILAVRDDVLSAITPAENDFAVLRVDVNGALWTRDDILEAVVSGNELQVDVVAPLPAGSNNIGLVDVNVITPGFAGTNLGKREDDAHTTLDVGVQMLAVRKATPADISDADGDYEPLQIDVGRLWVSATIDAAIPTGANVIGNVGLEAGTNNIGDVDVLSGPTGASALEVQGTAADGAAGVGNPVLVAGEESGGNVQSLLVDTLGHLQVDILTGGGTDTPTAPLTSQALVNLTAGSNGNVDDTDVAAATKKLALITLSSSLPWKARIMTVADAVETVKTILFGQANTSRDFRPTHRDYIQQGPAGAGFDGFRVEFTNMDNVDTGDFYASFYSED